MCIRDRFGAALLEERSSVLTHCNAGSLATAFFGTALGVIYEAALQSKIEMVYADETRPLRQGARLTAFELAKAQDVYKRQLLCGGFQ